MMPKNIAVGTDKQLRPLCFSLDYIPKKFPVM